MSRVIVIGGGASGMMAALAAARSGHKVQLLEKNEKLGKKIYITGKGRCNFTNDAPMEEFFGQTVSNPRFLYSAFAAFTNRDMAALLEDAQVPVKTERGGRMFPESDHASDVTKALEKHLRGAGVAVRLNTCAKRLLTKDGAVCGVETDRETVPSDAVIVATGGLSYPSTGSDGDGYRFARELGMVVRTPVPALVPIVTAEADLSEMQGLSLRNVCLRAFVPGKKKPVEREGELLFTHFGISGPLGLSLSSDIARLLAEGTPVPCEIDLKPALTDEQLDARLLREVDARRAKQFSHFYDELLPHTMIPVMTQRTGIDPGKRIGDVTRAERQTIRRLLKHFSLTAVGTRGFSEAIITQGGVDVSGIRPKTMESKTVQGLFFAGEVLDVDAYTGGFNLQIAWSTGVLAGRSVEQV